MSLDCQESINLVRDNNIYIYLCIIAYQNHFKISLII